MNHRHLSTVLLCSLLYACEHRDDKPICLSVTLEDGEQEELEARVAAGDASAAMKLAYACGAAGLPERTAYWYQRAVRLGDPTAKEKLEELKRFLAAQK